MSEKTKRFWWLKLRDDFFDQAVIKKLRRMAGGDTYTIIYLKMQLLQDYPGGYHIDSGICDGRIRMVERRAVQIAYGRQRLDARPKPRRLGRGITQTAI